MRQHILSLDHLLAPHAFVLTLRAILLMPVQISTCTLMIAALAPDHHLGTALLIVGLELGECQISRPTECTIEVVFVLPRKILQADRQCREEVLSSLFVR